jgi:hypothetical protein
MIDLTYLKTLLAILDEENKLNPNGKKSLQDDKYLTMISELVMQRLRQKASSLSFAQHDPGDEN